ncbi:hypothetical protein [Clostridium sp. HMSC19A10]|uniref:hypothetical protein n=1 Tax=Clostridium sp. HMSC19A10 TaxID=1581148 RepID=UPI0008A183CC|nr:hypothetical protein [Clostridium sp. HMSC19A10]OFS24190.1 hypothetical protein HMPREF3070_05930 [Clostridium sp. HMSC19A10]
MIIYKVLGKDGYLDLQFKNYDSDKMLIKFLSEENSVLNEWGMPEVDIITKGKKGDCPTFWVSTQLVVVSEKAKNELKDVWKADNVELLPMKCGDTTYYMLHIMQIQDISYDYGESYSIVFDKNQCEKNSITDKYLFRSYLKGTYKDRSIFVTDKFIERISDSDLKGFGFKKVWEE